MSIRIFIFLSEAAFSQFTAPLLKEIKGGNPAAAGTTIFTPFMLTAILTFPFLFFSKVVHVFILLQILKKSNSFFNYLNSIHPEFITQVDIIHIELDRCDNGFSLHSLGPGFVFLPGVNWNNHFTFAAPYCLARFNYRVIPIT